MKCKCELDFTVKKLNPACEIHNESDVYSNLVERLSEEREKILDALGEHPDSPVDIPQRIAAIRDEGRAHFHHLSQAQERIRELLEAEKELSRRRHALNCTICGCPQGY